MTEVGHMKIPINIYGHLVYLSDKPSLRLSEAMYVHWRWSKGKENKHLSTDPRSLKVQALQHKFTDVCR